MGSRAPHRYVPSQLAGSCNAAKCCLLQGALLLVTSCARAFSLVAFLDERVGSMLSTPWTIALSQSLSPALLPCRAALPVRVRLRSTKGVSCVHGTRFLPINVTIKLPCVVEVQMAMLLSLVTTHADWKDCSRLHILCITHCDLITRWGLA